jgi:hypothetical protein
MLQAFVPQFQLLVTAPSEVFETRSPDRLRDGRCRLATDSRNMRHAHTPIIAVEQVVDIEKNGLGHKIGAHEVRANCGEGASEEAQGKEINSTLCHPSCQRSYI